MTMPASGPISLFDARTELGLAGKISLQQSEVRDLFDVPAGAISLFDGYGKSAVTTLPRIISANNAYTYSTDTSAVFTFPYGLAAGDWFVIMISGRAVTTAPANSVLIGTATTNFYCCYIVCQGNEGGTTVSFTLASGTAPYGRYTLQIRDAKAAAANPARATYTDKYVYFDSFMTEKSNTLALGSVWAVGYAISTSDKAAYTPSANWTERIDNGYTYRPSDYEQRLIAAQSIDLGPPATVNPSPGYITLPTPMDITTIIYEFTG